MKLDFCAVLKKVHGFKKLYRFLCEGILSTKKITMQKCLKVWRDYNVGGGMVEIQKVSSVFKLYLEK